jgi:hypothetical protein
MPASHKRSRGARRVLGLLFLARTVFELHLASSVVFAVITAALSLPLPLYLSFLQRQYAARWRAAVALEMSGVVAVVVVDEE